VPPQTRPGRPSPDPTAAASGLPGPQSCAPCLNR